MSPDQQRRRALWLLAAAALVGALGVFLLLRDRPPELTAQALETARTRWRERRPASYVIRLRTRVHGMAEQTLTLEVRDGRALALELEGANPGSLDDYTVDGLFDTLARELELASGSTRGGYQTYLFARFDPLLGHPQLFRRLVGGGGGQAELEVLELRPSSQ